MKKIHTLKNSVSQFPLSPGVYVMKNIGQEILYVGKAKELRKRVQSYLRIQNSGKVEVLMSHVHRIEYIVTENEYEALLLEHNLIKEHQPKYNILLRDDKTFPLIKITKEEYPRILKTRKIIQDKSEYFGPYIDVFLMNKYLELVEKNFALRRCNRIKKREHPCLYYHLGRCTAVCAGLTSRDAYMSRVRKIRSLLNGRTKTLKKEITEQMHRHAQKEEYEQAGTCRDSLLALESLETQQHIIDHQDGVRNYVGISSIDNRCCIVVVHMKEGRVVDQHTTQLSTFDSLEDTLEQFLLSYYQEQGFYPEILYIPFPPSSEIKTFFSSYECSVKTPTSSQEVAIIRFAKENARFGVSRHIREQGNPEAVLTLQKVLGLRNPPMRIEGFDIATMHGKHTTASLVSFYNGVPDNTHYRYFKIKSLKEGQVDDFQSIQEAVSRRYSRLKNENKPLPDLILIDGGQGQVNAAHEILLALDLKIPVIGLAKKLEEIYFPGKLGNPVFNNKYEAWVSSRYAQTNPLQLPRDDIASRLIQHIRNEAHRFATNFREKRQIDQLHLTLYSEIAGIGTVRAKLLAELFPNPSSILETDTNILVQSAKISLSVATALKSHLKKTLEKS